VDHIFGEVRFDVPFKLSLKQAVFSELILDCVREECWNKGLCSYVTSRKKSEDGDRSHPGNIKFINCINYNRIRPWI